MSDLLKHKIPAGGQATFAGGLYFKLVRAPIAPVGLKFHRESIGDANAATAPSGYRIGPLPETRRFSKVTVTSAVDQTITVVVGDDEADVEDVEVEINPAIKAGFRRFISEEKTLVNSNQFEPAWPFGFGVVVHGIQAKGDAANTVPIEVIDSTGQLPNGYNIDAGETLWIPYGYKDAEVFPNLSPAFLTFAVGQKLHYIIYYDDFSVAP